MNWHWLRHDWSPWNPPKDILWRYYIAATGETLRETSLSTQTRTCSTCKKVDYRVI